jgi:integrase
MARLYKRGRIWWAWGYYANGERWVESTQCRDERAATRLAERWERERAAVDRAEVEALPLEQALEDVIAAKRREGKHSYTVADYERAGGHLCRVLGSATDVHAFTLASLEGYIDRRTSEQAMRSTIATELAKLRSALRYAKRHGRYRGEVAAIWPADALRNAHVPHDRYLTREEYAKLHAALAFNGRPDYLAAYVFTGARRSEVWTIRPEDVDLDRGTMVINGTKTRSARRVVPIASELRPVIERRLRETAPKAPLFPRWEENSVLKRAALRAGIPHVCANDLRRTFCSWLAQAGVPLLVTVKLMGHRSAEMVTTVYARFGSDDLAAAIDRLPGGLSLSCSNPERPAFPKQPNSTDAGSALLRESSTKPRAHAKVASSSRKKSAKKSTEKRKGGRNGRQRV